LLIFLTTCDNSSKSQVKKEITNTVTVKVFSSLTCPHCATFHKEVFEDLKREYIVAGRVVFEHHSFPLDLAALNAEIILRCKGGDNIDYSFLSEIYEKQDQWAIGSDINIINKSIKKIGKNYGLSEKKINECLENKKIQDQILNSRIESQKKYKISSTPTILINEKRYKGNHNYKEFKKKLEKFF
jgi:protein-disulfide isomerase